MSRLSDHFSSHEFACKGTDCCGGSSPVDGRLIDALEEFRTKVGGPVRINSGFRCLIHNRNVGSNDSSQHPRGRAADIAQMNGFTIDEMLTIIESIDAFSNGGIGKYDDFVHVDVREDGPSRWNG